MVEHRQHVETDGRVDVAAAPVEHAAVRPATLADRLLDGAGNAILAHDHHGVVRFLNTATIQHQVVGRSATWGSVLLDPGQEHSETFAAAGIYPYTCPLHPGMVGAIVVGDGQAPAADLAVASPSAADTAPAMDDTAPPTDPIALVVTGLAGLGVGLGIGALAMRSRPRTTD